MHFWMTYLQHDSPSVVNIADIKEEATDDASTKSSKQTVQAFGKLEADASCLLRHLWDLNYIVVAEILEPFTSICCVSFVSPPSSREAWPKNTLPHRVRTKMISSWKVTLATQRLSSTE